MERPRRPLCAVPYSREVNTSMISEVPLESELTVDRRAANRRKQADRRVNPNQGSPTGEERRVSTRRKVERRRQIDPTTCERDYDDEEVEFMRAMDEYKRRAGRQFPTWSEVLEVLRSLGYRKVAEQSPLYGTK